MSARGLLARPALLICLTGVISDPSTSCRERLERPNIVFILVDDLGWHDVGFMGQDFFETPHLDRLAAEGMTFRQAYANGPNCAPTPKRDTQRPW